MAEKLSITIFLEGAAEIERQLEGIGQAGTKAFEEIGKAAEGVGGFDKLDPKDVQAKLEKFGVTGKAAINKITTAVAQAGRLERIVGGVRQVEAGFARLGVAASAMSQSVTTAFTSVATAAASTGGAIGRVGRALGILGSGAIIGSVGALVVGMETAADKARVLEANLQAVFRNAAAGTAFFNQIQNAARTAGTSLESTGKVLLDIFRLLQSGLKAKGIIFAPGEGFKQTRDEAVKLFDTLQKGMKLSGATSKETEKAIADLVAEFEKTGQLSGNTLRKLARDFPQLANELVKFLGMPGQTMEQLADQVDRGIRKVDIPKFTNAVKQATPAIDGLSAAFDPTLAQRMDTIGGAWDRLLDSFGASPAGAVIKRLLDDIKIGMDEIAARKPPTTWTGILLQSLVSVGKAFNEIGKKFGEQPPVDVTQEPAWVQAYLGFIEKVKIAFKSMFAPAEAPEGQVQQPAWVEAYLGFIDKVKQAFLNMFTKKPEVGGQLGGGAVPLFGSATPGLEAIGAARIEDRRGGQALEALRASAQAVFAQIQQMGTTAFAAISAAAEQAAQSIAGMLTNIISPASAAFSNLQSVAITAMQNIAAAIQWTMRVLQQFIALSEQAANAFASAVRAAQQAEVREGFGAPGASGFARGGLFGGRGTGTSDSNLAWVSRGEHIMPASAVRQPGVLAFLEALRRSGGNLRDVLDDMGRFALGGLVPRAIPAFATGGLAGGGMSNVTIQFPGMPEITGLRAPAKVVEELRKTAALAQVRSGGRKPSRYS